MLSLKKHQTAMTRIKEIADINWSEPFDLTTSDDTIPQDFISCLQKSFGHSSFREMQWKVISSILHERRDNCVIMATGYGKSLCYQFLSIYLDTITVVVSPLISLMQDQVLALRFYKLRACFLGSAQENRDTLYEVIDRQYNIVYVTPEYITSDSGVLLLNKINEYLTLIAIDEAHCISKWGHDFRAAYRNLSRLRNICPTVPILAVTATATPRVTDDIIQNLKLNNAQIISTGFDRPNLEFGVKQKSETWSDIGPHIKNIKIGSVIVYCSTKRITEKVAAEINANGQLCGVYHAGLSLTQRKKTHEDFIHDRIRVVCATIAFGMGINKPDVRLVIHYGVAKDVESYYQEVGRAGRDGLPAKCLMFYKASDWAVLSLIRSKCQRADTMEEMDKLTSAMREYVSTNQCRRRFILSYFGENTDNLKTRPNCCDNCKRQDSSSSNTTMNLFNRYEGLSEDGLLDITDDATKILTLVQNISGMMGLQKVLSILKGSKAKSVPDQYLRHPLYGDLKQKPIKWLEAVGNHLHVAGMLVAAKPKFKSKWFHPTCAISPKGIQQLNSGHRIKIKPGDEFIRLLKIKVNSLPKVLAAKPADNQLSIRNGTVTIPSQPIIQKSEVPTLNDIYRPLLNVRLKLANLFDVGPHLVASTKALQQLANAQPTSMDELRKLELDGYSEEKTERFGPVFLKVIRDYHVKIGKSDKSKEQSNTNTITRHLIVCDSCEGPSTSSNNVNNTLPSQGDENPKTKKCDSSKEQNNEILSEIEGQSVQCSHEEEDDEDAVTLIEPTPPPLIEIIDTDSESESFENWGSEIRDSELLRASAEVDENCHQDLDSDSDNDELDLLIAALKTDKFSTAQVNTRNQKHPPDAVEVEHNCLRNNLPDNKVVSNNKPKETNDNSLPKRLNKTEVDFDRDLFDEYWDSDVNDLDLTQISEKAEHEIQESTTLCKDVQSQISTLPPNNAIKREVQKEATELDLFLDEIKSDLNRNQLVQEQMKKNTNEEAQKPEKKVRIIKKTSNAFEYENDSSSDSEDESKVVISPKKRILPSWMQLSNKRKR